MGLLNNFKAGIVRLPVTNTTLILATCTCSVQGSDDPYCFFPVNPFVDETDLSFEKKRDFHAQTSFR